MKADTVGSLLREVALRACLAACVMAAAAPALAVAPAAGLPGQHHQAWSFAEGAPADVWALAQAPDGYLWLGTGSGLYRFDGERFESVPLAVGQSLPSNNITALAIGRAGDAWIGFYAAGIARLQHGKLENDGVEDGLPEGMVYRIVDDGRGTTWAAVDGGLARHRDGRWQTMTAREGYPWKHADWLLLDREGTLWVSTGETIAYQRRGDARFRKTGARSTLNAVIAQAPDGAIWVSDNLGTRVLRAAAGAAAPAVIPDLQAKRLLFRSDGTLWGTDARNGGVFRIATRGGSEGKRIERFGPRQGLSAHVAVPVLEDREGDMWVGTNLGLDRFRPTSVMPVPDIAETAPAGYGLAVVNGRASIASGGALYDLDSRGARLRIPGLPTILAAHGEMDGTLWLIGFEKLHRVRGDDVVEVSLPGGRLGRDIRAMAADERGLWVSIMHQGLYRLENGRWSKQPLRDRRVPDVIATDGARTWLGFVQDRIELREAGRIRTFTAADGLSVGNVSAIHAENDTLYVAGEQGLAWRDGQRFHTISQQRMPALNGITGIVVSDGSLWLNGNLGVVRLARDALRRSAAGWRLPEPMLLDALDGVPGIALQASPVPTVLRGKGSVLWFATNQGVAWLDTERLPVNRHAPPVSIRAVVADGRAFTPMSKVELPKRTASLQIDYTATSLAMPERVRFRYRLDGVDDAWVDAGTRRQAFYTNPAPGDYSFRVIAANQDGVWNTQGATLKITIPPMFYQTRWFVALCIVAAGGILWVLYMLRLKELGIHIRSRLHERHLERERIARELHDTLLQSIQGLILRFQAAAERLPNGDASRDEMERVLDRADAVLAEGRNRVLDLRSSSTDGDDLSDAFTKVAADLAVDHPAAFRVITEGAAQQLDPIVRDELFGIGREALANAYRHADAEKIDVEIVHARDELRLRFMDDGRGIDTTVLEGGRPGHWGLSGMRERAERIEATLRVRSRQGSGTEVEVRMPAGSAYRPCLKKSRWALVRRLFQEEVSP